MEQTQTASSTYTPVATPRPGQNGPIDKAAFNRRYWFTSLQLVEVMNPLWLKEGDGFVSKDYQFTVEMRHFIIRAGGQEKFPGVIANVYLDQITKIMAQNEDKLEFMSDPNLMKQYYDRVIVNVENLAPEYDPTPSYMQNVAPTSIGQAVDDTPPWAANMEQAGAFAPVAPVVDPRVDKLEAKVDSMGSLLEAMAAKMGVAETPSAPPAPVSPFAPEPQVQSTAPVLPQAPSASEPTSPSEPVEKKFTYENSEYKMIVDKNGNEMFYMDGRRTSAADYAKAASML